MRTRSTHAINTFPLAVPSAIIPTTVGVTIIVPDASEIPGGYVGRICPIVLFTELEHINTGRSVTNAIEDIANAARRLLNDPYGHPLSTINPKDIVWLEMYSDNLSYNTTGTTLTVDWVDLRWRNTYYGDPQWARIVARPTKYRILIPARLDRRLGWMGGYLPRILMTEAEKAEAALHTELLDRLQTHIDSPIQEISP